jgi:N-methylhydantoinase A
MSYHVGVDVGGTFTDAIAIDAGRGAVKLSKVPSTPPNQEIGFLNGLEAVDIAYGAISWLVHGTTVGTNATLERNGAVCGMITTRGFRDIIELARRERPQLYGLFGEFEPLILRSNRLEVSERLDAEGNVLETLNEDELRVALETLKANGVEALLIGFLHAYANPVHEERARNIAEEVWPTPYITTSAAILREFREVERFGTAAVNAYIQPLIHRYITRLEGDLRQIGVERSLAIMQANGGIMSAEMACTRSVNTVLSGPAAGVIAAAYISRLSGFGNVVTCDMGGTSFDVGMIVAGQPIVSSDRDLGFNLPMRIPVIDIHTIGAGGGSIAHLNEANMLQVGPRSAGAVPGPISYGRGGNSPTVTDANVLLGRLSSDELLGVEGGVDVDRVRRAFADQIGAPLGIGAPEAAAATLRIINDSMAGAIRLVSLQRGYDPREFAIFAFGGAGPLHGTALARELGVPHVIVPYVPGITCALGCVVADVRHDFVQTMSRLVDGLSEDELREVLRQHRREGEARLQDDKVPVERVEVEHEADMQYEGQTYSLRVPVDPDTVSVERLKDTLRQAYIDRFGIDLSNFRAKLINVRTAVVGIRAPLDLRRIVNTVEKRASVEDTKLGERDVWFDGTWVRTPIYERATLPPGATIEGPAIFNQMDSTAVAEPGNRIHVDEVGNLVIEVQ